MVATAKYSKTRFLFARKQIVKMAKKNIALKNLLVIQKNLFLLRGYTARFYPRKYMTDDQRFAAKRQDVIVLKRKY
jgi:hypothetical protein